MFNRYSGGGWKEIQKTAAEQRQNRILCIEKRQMKTDEKETNVAGVDVRNNDV